MSKRPILFFDWDGTLADSMPLCMEGTRLTLQRMGLPSLPDSRLKACNGPTYAETVDMLDIPPERAEEYIRLRLRAELELVPRVQRLFPGIRDMLNRLRTQAELVIVSNGMADYLAMSTRMFLMEDWFVRIQACIPGKTKAEALAMLLKELAPDRAVMVGDRLGDLTAGRANGLPTVAACYGYGTPEEWAQADHQARTVGEMETLLHKLIMKGR